MLLQLLEKAISLGGTSVEIEHRYGKEEITAFNGPIGFGIACLEGEDGKSLFTEMDQLRKTRRALIGGVEHRLVFSGYESFGEWVHRIQIMQPRSSAKPAQKRRKLRPEPRA
jgi:hypothetical protein